MSVHAIERAHQILITDDMELPAQLPERLRLNIDHLRHFHPGAQCQLWSGNALRKFIRENFEPEVLEAFDALKPYAFKCDLARYCLLYVYGGLYVDLALCMVNEWKIPTKYKLATFRELPDVNWAAIQCGLMWAVPGQLEFKIAIELIVENCRNQYYGANALCPTGPELLGKAFILALSRQPHQSMGEHMWIGSVEDVTPRSTRNIQFIDPLSNLIARKAKTIDADIKHLGFNGTNNYNAIWNGRKAYGETRNAWVFESEQIRLSYAATRTSTGIQSSPKHVGMVTFGPYIDLLRGQHRITFKFSERATFSKIRIDVCADCGNKILGESTFTKDKMSAEQTVSIDVQADSDLAQVEFRFYVEGDFTGELLSIERENIATP